MKIPQKLKIGSHIQVMEEQEKLRDKISQILVKWDMPTRQVAINEILALTVPKQTLEKAITDINCMDKVSHCNCRGKAINEIVDYLYALFPYPITNN